ncbi:MAG: hypothetical protein JW850_06780 [Thermoflexales bacterium]|nr:hypothetical protein [Thermoflexales bacterium]
MRVKLIKSMVFIVICVSVMNAGCKGPSPTSTVSPVSVSPLATAAPPPAASATPPVFPTSQPGLGTITGILLQRTTRATILLGEIYLGEVIETTEPGMPVVGLDKAVAPQAVIDRDTGQFVFYDVSPGRYALEVWIPLSNYILVDDPKGGTQFVTITGDESVDVGTVWID